MRRAHTESAKHALDSYREGDRAAGRVLAVPIEYKRSFILSDVCIPI